MIQIKIDIKEVLNVSEKIHSSLSNLTDFHRRVAYIMHRAVDDNFESQGRPRWMGLKSAERNKNNGKILQQTGQLKASITDYYDASVAKVGTNKAYAAIHQFGGKTSPHIIAARYAKKLKFGNVYRKKVNHPGSDIPARPFLMLDTSDTDDIMQLAMSYLQKNIK